MDQGFDTSDCDSFEDALDKASGVIARLTAEVSRLRLELDTLRAGMAHRSPHACRPCSRYHQGGQ